MSALSRDRPLLAVISYALALSMKLQAIFFLPILIGYLLRRPHAVRTILIIPCVYVALTIPALVGGGNISYWLFVYAHEAREYPYLSVSAPNAFALLSGISLSADVQTILFWIGITLAVVAASIFVYCVVRMARDKDKTLLLYLSFACVLIIPYLLPRMHERYFYLADIFSVLYALADPRKWHSAFLVVGASFLSYMPYLSSQVPALGFAHIVDIRMASMVMLAAIVCVIGDPRLRIVLKKPLFSGN